MRTVLDCCRGLPEQTFAAGQRILEEGKRVGMMYILAEGAVEILKDDFQINTLSEPGSIFGEVSVLLDVPHMATVKTTQPSRFYVTDDPRAFLEANPTVMFHVARLLAKRLRNVTSYLVDLKQQFESHEDHLGMVDEVLESLVHHQDDE